MPARCSSPAHRGQIRRHGNRRNAGQPDGNNGRQCRRQPDRLSNRAEFADDRTAPATVTLLPSGSGSTTNPTDPNNINFSSTLTSLSIAGAMNAWTGTLDIGNNGLVIAYGSGADPYATIDNMIESGYNGGLGWHGITSSLARAAAMAPARR